MHSVLLIILWGVREPAGQNSLALFFSRSVQTGLLKPKHTTRQGPAGLHQRGCNAPSSCNSAPPRRVLIFIAEPSILSQRVICPISNETAVRFFQTTVTILRRLSGYLCDPYSNGIIDALSFMKPTKYKSKTKKKKKKIRSEFQTMFSSLDSAEFKAAWGMGSRTRGREGGREGASALGVAMPLAARGWRGAAPHCRLGAARTL